MTIDVHVICWNEIELLPYFMKHYKTFARNIYVYDNYSTDGSAELAAKLGAVVIRFGTKELNDGEYLKIKNSRWKNSTADWVVVCDMDEFLYHRHLVELLTIYKETGIQLPEIQGYNIYSELTPNGTQIYESIKTGFKSESFSKQIIFDPKIGEINFQYGCHSNSAHGIRGGLLYMLHYRCIGGVEKMINRHNIYAQRMSKFNHDRRLGVHYLRTEYEIRKDWAENIAQAREIDIL